MTRDDKETRAFWQLELVQISEAEAIKVLMRSEISLLKAIHWARGVATEIDGEWFIADLKNLAGSAGTTYDTAIGALSGLKKCGLVATQRSYRLYDAKKGGFVAHADHNWYYAPGRAEEGTMWLPKTSWGALVARVSRAPTLAARMCLRTGLKPLAKPPRPRWLRRPNEAVANYAKPATGGSYSYSLKENKESNDVIDGRASPSQAQTRSILSSPSDEAEAWLGERQLFDDLRRAGANKPRPRFHTGYVAHFRPVDPPDPDPPFQVGWIPNGCLNQDVARLVAEGFRDACREVYGVDPYSYARFDFERAQELHRARLSELGTESLDHLNLTGPKRPQKGAPPPTLNAREAKMLATYRRLLTCGFVMRDHSVPPKHWCVWRMRWTREHNPRFKDRPPPIFMLCSARSVAQRAGWFRKEYDLASLFPRRKVDFVRLEQFYRNMEAASLEQGLVSAKIIPGPQWYWEKRKLEILDGFTDPMVRYPTKKRVA